MFHLQLFWLGRQTKDSAEETREKELARRRRKVDPGHDDFGPSCGERGHRVKRSRPARTVHGFYNFGRVYYQQRSFESRKEQNNFFILFLRETIYKVQTLINFYILNLVDTLTDDIFTQQSWYTICRFIYGNLSINKNNQV